MRKVKLILILAIAISCLNFAVVQADGINDTFTQQILPLNCIFTLLNNGTNQIVYVTPQACGVPVQVKTNSSSTHRVAGANNASNASPQSNQVQLIVSQPRHIVITPKIISGEQLGSSQASTNPNTLPAVGSLPPIIDLPNNLTPIGSYNVEQSSIIVAQVNEVYSFPVDTGVGNSNNTPEYHTLTVTSINDSNHNPTVKIVVSTDNGSIPLTLRVGQTIVLAVTNKHIVDVGITLNGLNAKLVSLTIWQLQPTNINQSPGTTAQSNEVAIVVLVGIAIATLARPLHKNLISKKR